MSKLTEFGQGVLAGIVMTAIVFGFLALIKFCNNRDKELFENAERQREIEFILEEHRNRDPYEFLDDIPGVRGAADNAIDDFRRNRDEILDRFRNPEVSR